MSGASTPTESNADRVLDTRGLNCPMPILKAKKTLNEMTGGSLLKILATDPGAVRDFEYFCRHTGHQLMESTESEGEFRFLIRRKG
ncbi:MAG: sulfurtransferase TusA family protein [Betaproteobacteria bacterium]